jgi:hypothetical protein
MRISYELSAAIRYRQKTRIFGDIDNTITTLTAGEILSNEINQVFMSEVIKNLFERESTFYKFINKK